MRKFRASWIFPVVVIAILLGLAYFLLMHYKEGLVTTSLSSPTPIAINSIKYNGGNMTATRVWRDIHPDGQWLWEEIASADPNLVQLKGISEGHTDQTLALDLVNNQYIWTKAPGATPMIYQIEPNAPM